MMIKFDFWKDKYELPVISIVVILCILVLSVSFFTKFTSSYDDNTWQAQNYEPAQSFQPALVLEDLYIYPLPDENTFVVHSITTGESTWRNARSPIDTMQAVPIVGGDGYHLVWHTKTDEVWHAQISLTGEFLLFPEQLAEKTVTGFDVAALPNGGAMIIWRTATEFTHPLAYAMLTEDGIPYRRGRWLRDVDDFALNITASGDIGLVWFTNLATTQRLNYTRFDFDTFRYGLDTVLTETIEEIDVFIPPSVWISDFDLVSDDETWLAVWGQTNINSLEQTDYFILPLAEDAQTVPLWRKDTRWRWLGDIGYSEPALQTTEIVLNGYIDNAWRPVHLTLNDTGIVSLETISDLSAEGSQTRLWIGQDSGDIYASWLRFSDQQDIVQTIAIRNDSSVAHQAETEDDRASFFSLFLQGLVWLVLPLWLMVVPLTWSNSSRRTLMVLGYWLLKLGVSLDALHQPPELWDLGLAENWRILLGASLAAGLPLAWLGGRRLSWQISLIGYLTCDMLLTVVLFAQL